MRSLQLSDMMGFWYVIQYYSSSEETVEYKCMKGDMEMSDNKEVSSEVLYFWFETKVLGLASISRIFDNRQSLEPSLMHRSQGCIQKRGTLFLEFISIC